MVSIIETIDDDALIVPIKERHRFDELVAMIVKFYSASIDKYNKMVSALYCRGSYP